NLEVGVDQAVPRRRTVQHVRVDVVGLEVLERACEGLGDLFGEARSRVIRQAVILARRVGELRLQKELGTRAPLADCFGNGFANVRFHVVASLVGGVDGRKPGLHGRGRELFGTLLLPCRAVHESRNRHPSYRAGLFYARLQEELQLAWKCAERDKACDKGGRLPSVFCGRLFGRRVRSPVDALRRGADMNEPKPKKDEKETTPADAEESGDLSAEDLDD